MCDGRDGSIAMHAQARLARKSSTGAHVPPPSTVCHTPPPALADHIRAGSLGSMTIPSVRPPMFPGPIHSQTADSRPATGSPPGTTAGPVGTPAADRLDVV